MFLIQGVFFQNQQWLGTTMVPVDGMVAVVEGGLIYDMFAGVIRADHTGRAGCYTGGLMDHYGESVLHAIIIADDQLHFTKKYLKRTDMISYSFLRKDGSTWIGTYKGSAVGKGVSRCILTEVKDDFVDPRLLAVSLGLTEAHTWQ